MAFSFSAHLRVELHREPGPRAVDDALVRPIVGIHHQRHPALGQAPLVHGIAMVLRGDVAALRAQVHHGLVHAPVAELHLVGAGARRQRQDPGLLDTDLKGPQEVRGPS